MPPRTQALPLPQLRPTQTRAQNAVSSQLRRAQRLQNLPATRRILGVDPGLHRTGYGVIDIESTRTARFTLKLVEGGVIKPNAKDELPQRLQVLYAGLQEILHEHEPDVVVIEELFSTYAHPRSALLMAHGRGALMLAAAHAKIPVHSFLPNEIKQVVAGNGHATKSAIQSAVKARLNLAATLHPPDVADALAIAICFALRRDAGEKLK